MSAQTKIEWADSTWNPWIGCTRVSPACDDCYAARSTPARRYGIQWGAGRPRRRTSVANWKLPLRWNKAEFYACPDCGWRGEGWMCGNAVGNGGSIRGCKGEPVRARRRVFCASLADWLDNEVPIEWLVDLLDLIRLTPNLDWLLLTKRIGAWRFRLLAAEIHASNDQFVNERGAELGIWLRGWLFDSPPPNVWLGATVVNQEEADRDIPKLLRVPARVRFLSIEPMLGAVDLTRLLFFQRAARPSDAPRAPSIDWIICGGESGPHARPMHPDWVRSLRDQCAVAGVPFLFKQWGEWAPNYLTENGERIESTMWMDRMGKKAAGRQLDGREHSEFPA
jgi:protein gp37